LAPGIAAGFMLLLCVGLLALAASPELHHRLHKDAQSASHACVITQLEQQGLLSGIALVTAPLPDLVPSASFPNPELFVPSTRDYRLSPSRAPPVLLSHLTVAG
jgi:hypothetical protein